MRKSASVILLLILLFNMVGYRVWFHYAERQSDVRLEARLDNSQYEENDLIALTVPLDNPYQLEQTSFVRVDGEISFGGKSYKYVKRKVQDGKLILLCLPDMHKTILKKAKADYGQEVNNLPANTKSPSKSGLQKNFSGSDYISTLARKQILEIGSSTSTTFCSYTESLTEHYLSVPGQPPKC